MLICFERSDLPFTSQALKFFGSAKTDDVTRGTRDVHGFTRAVTGGSGVNVLSISFVC